MAKRVGIILSGCGQRDGTDVAEAMITLLALDRAGAEIVCAAPDQPQAVLANHVTGEAAPAKPPKRNALVEAARLARGAIRNLAALGDRDIDALIIPGSAASSIGALAGNPAIVVPWTMLTNPGAPASDPPDQKTRPYGFSFLGAQCSEPRLLALAYAFEQATHVRHPPKATP